MRSLPSILLFALVWFSAVWFGSWHWNPNNSVRMFAALSIVEDGDATIDEFEHLTIDKARFGPHFYLDKAPGMTLMALPAVALADRLTGDRAAGKTLSLTDPALDRFMKLRTWLAAASINATLLALAAVALMDFGRRIVGSVGAGAFAAIAFALGTPLWGWATTLFGHAAVASLLVMAARQVLKGTEDDRGRFDALIAGFVLGWALVIEHSALLFALPIGLWALWRMQAMPRSEAIRAAIDAVIGGAAAMLPLLAYNMFAYGDPFRLGYQGVVGWSGMDQGLFGLTYPRLGVLAQIIGGERRGLVWVAPILLASIPALAIVWRAERRGLFWLSLGGAMMAFFYNAAYVYWDGGNATGPRHAMPAVAFLSLVLPFVWARAVTAVRAGLATLLAISVAINAVIASAEITVPPTAANALLDGVWHDRFAPGYLRTIPNEFFGMDPWLGFAMWFVAAALLFGALLTAIARQARSANIYRTDGATRRS